MHTNRFAEIPYIHDHQVLRTDLAGNTKVFASTVYPQLAQDIVDLARIVEPEQCVFEIHLTDNPELGNVEGARLQGLIEEWAAYKARVLYSGSIGLRD